jgi:sn-glycerol 3-phosphate transport system substrate-binding protein
VVVVCALVVAACSGGDDDSGGGEAKKADCPLSALDKAAAKGPVELTFWHTMTRKNQDALVLLTNRFNTSQKQVKVKLLNNNDGDDQHEKYVATLRTDKGGLPDLVQEQEFFLQQDVDTQSMLPVQACMDKAKVDTADYVARALNYYKIDGVQWGMPFAVSEPILLYSRSSFKKAGLDPDKPPTTFDELRSASQALKSHGFEAGLALKLDPWHLEQMLAWQGKPFVDNGNGRDKRATAVSFDSEPAAVDTFKFLKSMVDDKLALTTSTEGPGIDNLLDVGTRKVGMTIDASGALGTILDVLNSGQYAGIDPDAAPVPGRTSDGGVLIGGSGLYISAQEPAKQAAAWKFIDFLTSPGSQATWSAATGFAPVRRSAADKPVLQQRWGDVPAFKVAYDEIVEGAENDATAGPAIGDYKGVRDALKKAESQMFLEGATPEKAVKSAAQKSNQLIKSYNDRL